MSRAITFVPLVILLTLQVALSAEPDAPRAKAYNPDDSSILSLLRDASTLKSLELSDAQRQSLDDVQVRWAREFELYARLDGASEHQDAYNDLKVKLGDFEKQSVAILSDEQRKQLQQIERRRRWRRFSPVARIDGAPLQDELHLTNEQGLAIRNLLDQWVDECEQLYQARTGSDPDLSAGHMFVKIGAKYEKQRDDLIRDTLTKEQQERLTQIELQMSMSMASARELAKPELADKLKLTPEQRKRIDEILEQHAEQRRAAEAKLSAGERPRLQFLFLKGLEVLTTKQKEQLRELIGKPYGFGARLEQALVTDSNNQAETKSDQ